MVSFGQDYFPTRLFDCYFEVGTDSPLVVSPHGDAEIDLIDWARKHQREIAQAIQQFGAIVFSGFNFNKGNFSEAFTAITGMPTQAYQGDSHRDEVSPQIYQSTALNNRIPPHQEIAGGYRKNMPQRIAFLCVTPSTEGTGKTLVVNVEKVSKEIEALMPELWSSLSKKTLTYTARYLPENSWRTKWIRWLNPSHATLKQRFGTENKQEIEKQCLEEGLTCEWDGGWAVISRKGIPATIQVNGKTLFCNAIHIDRMSPQLCGGWIPYILARILLYHTTRSMQYDVQFDDGTQITRQDAGRVLNILKKHETGRSWKKGDLMILNNPTTMHAKTSHIGKREILVAMGGSAEAALQTQDPITL